MNSSPQPGLLETLQRLWSFGRPYRAFFVGAALAMVAQSLAGFLRPYILKLLTDHMVTGAGDAHTLALLLAAMLGATVLKAVFTFLQGYLLTVASQGTVRALREALFTHVLRLPLGWFEARPVGDLLVRFTDETRLVAELLNGGLSQLATGGLVIVASAGWMAWMDSQLAVLAVIVMPAAGLVTRRFSRRSRHATEAAQQTMSDLSSVVKETVEGMKAVKTFGAEAHEARRFSERNHERFRWDMRLVAFTATQSPILEVLSTTGVVLVVWYCSLNVMSGRLSLGDLFAFWGYASMASSPLKRMADTWAGVTRGCSAAGRLFEWFDVPAQGEGPDADETPGTVRGRIDLEEVRFSYDPTRGQALKGLSFGIEAGEHVAVVGPNGAGKSTLANLLPRLYEVTAGTIAVDGQSIDRVRLRWLREQVGIVPQETFLFSGTVRDNLSYGRRDATEAQVEAAARAAGVHDFVMALPLGYDTVLVENGRNLSGGQRQRLAIARLIVRDPAIVILDEATASLDADAEHAVYDALRRATRGRTVISIMHRLTLARSANRIVVLDEGKVCEMGTHGELTARQGLYYSLSSLLVEGTDR